MKKMNKLLAIGLSLVMCAGMIAPAFAATFTDLQEAINGGETQAAPDLANDENVQPAESVPEEPADPEQPAEPTEPEEPAEPEEPVVNKPDDAVANTDDTHKNGALVRTENDTNYYGYGWSSATDDNGDTKWYYGIEAHDAETGERVIVLLEDVEYGGNDQSGIVVDGGKVNIDLNGHDIDLNPNVVYDAQQNKYYQATTDENGDKVEITDLSTLNCGTVIAAVNGADLTIKDSSAEEVTEELPGTIVYDENGKAVSIAEGDTHTVTYYQNGKGSITGGCNLDRTDEGSGITIRDGSTVTLNGANVEGNLSEGLGGGGILICGNSKLIAKGGQIQNNRAGSGAGSKAHGGGINIYEGGCAYLTGVDVSRNFSYNSGGGVAVGTNATLLADQCQFTYNLAQFQSGGAISANGNPNSKIFVMNSTVTNNQAMRSPGGIGDSFSSPAVVFHSNVCNNTPNSFWPSSIYHQNDAAWKDWNPTPAAHMDPKDVNTPGYNWYKCNHCTHMYSVPLYMVAIDGNGANETYGPQQVEKGGKVDDFADPTREGYRFAGWVVVGQDGVEKPFDPNASVESGMTIRATWTEIPEGIDGTGETEIDDQAVPLASGPITRAQFIDYLWRHEGEPDSEGVCTFTDVEDTHEYFDALCWAEENGVAKAYLDAEGHEDGAFEPDELVTVEAVREFLGNFETVFGAQAVAAAELTTLTGEDGEAVLNCDQVLAEFFGEEYELPEDLDALEPDIAA